MCIRDRLTLVRNTAKHIVDMIEDGANVVVSHGNGPQAVSYTHLLKGDSDRRRPRPRWLRSTNKRRLFAFRFVVAFASTATMERP